MFKVAEKIGGTHADFSIRVSTSELVYSPMSEAMPTHYNPKRNKLMQLGTQLTESAIETCKLIGVDVGIANDNTVPKLRGQNQLSIDAFAMALADLDVAKPYDPKQKPKNAPRPKSKSIGAAKKHISRLEMQLASCTT